MAKAYKYQGVLGKPRKSVTPPLEDESYNPFDEECQAALLMAKATQYEALIDALFEDCGVDRNDVFGWQSVALKLAERHVKAFQQKEKSWAKS